MLYRYGSFRYNESVISEKTADRKGGRCTMRKRKRHMLRLWAALLTAAGAAALAAPAGAAEVLRDEMEMVVSGGVAYYADQEFDVCFFDGASGQSGLVVGKKDGALWQGCAVFEGGVIYASGQVLWYRGRDGAAEQVYDFRLVEPKASYAEIVSAFGRDEVLVRLLDREGELLDVWLLSGGTAEPYDGVPDEAERAGAAAYGQGVRSAASWGNETLVLRVDGDVQLRCYEGSVPGPFRVIGTYPGVTSCAFDGEMVYLRQEEKGVITAYRARRDGAGHLTALEELSAVTDAYRLTYPHMTAPWGRLLVSFFLLAGSLLVMGIHGAEQEDP